MNKYNIKIDELNNYIDILKPFDKVYLSGTVYTARDQAHKKLFNLINDNKNLPIDLKDAVIYYAGPTKKPLDLPIGSCGPTTSKRMDMYTKKLHELGVIATIGKGDRSGEVYQAIKDNKALYLCALGGAGALACNHIKESKEIAFLELGCESIKKLTLENFPLIVGINSYGDSAFSRRNMKE